MTGITEEDMQQSAYLQLLIDSGCKFKMRTILFGKAYVWMQDQDGTYFLERIPNVAEEQ